MDLETAAGLEARQTAGENGKRTALTHDSFGASARDYEPARLPIVRYINIEDSEEVLRAINRNAVASQSPTLPLRLRWVEGI